MDDLEEMDRFLEKFNLPRLKQVEIEIVNSILSTEIEDVTKILPENKSPGPDSFTGKFYRTFREELMPVLLKLFQTISEDGTLPNSSPRPPSPWYQNQTKIAHKKKTTGQYHW